MEAQPRKQRVTLRKAEGFPHIRRHSRAVGLLQIFRRSGSLTPFS